MIYSKEEIKNALLNELTIKYPFKSLLSTFDLIEYCKKEGESAWPSDNQADNDTYWENAFNLILLTLLSEELLEEDDLEGVVLK